MRRSSLLLLSITGFLAACGSSSSNPGTGGDSGVNTNNNNDAGIGGDDGGTGHDSGTVPVDAGVDSSGPFVEAPHPALPGVVDQGLPVIHTPKVVTVTFTGDTNAAQLTAFGAQATNNAWWDTVRAGYCETGSTTACVGDGPAGTSVVVPAAQAPKATYDDTATPTGLSPLQTYISGLITGGTIKQPDDQTILVLYFPTTTTITKGTAPNQETSCVQFGGYHHSMTVAGTTFAYAIVPECTPQTGSPLTTLQSVTLAASHEIVEAATDPFQGPPTAAYPAGTLGYYLDFNDPAILAFATSGFFGENGDNCVDIAPNFNTDSTTEGGFTVQRIWSPAAAAAGLDPCVPAVPATPYFNVAPDLWFVNTAVGSTATFTATAFSTGPMPTWTVRGVDLDGTKAAPYFTITINGQASLSGVKNGDKLTIAVTLKQDPGALTQQRGGARAVLLSLDGANTGTKTASQGHIWPFLVSSPADAADSGLDQVDAASDLARARGLMSLKNFQSMKGRIDD